MKLFHVTSKGNLHFQLSDGRLAAVYPTTGYVRVSGSFKFFIRPEFEERRRQFYDEVVEAKTPGKVAMWPINKRNIVTTKVAVKQDLYYRARWNNEVYKYPHDVFYEMESSKCELFPGDIIKLMDLLVAFENKNCPNTSRWDLNCSYGASRLEYDSNGVLLSPIKKKDETYNLEHINSFYGWREESRTALKK